MQVTFFGARIFFIGHLPREGFNYVQLIRSDGTPPTQAPPSNSGCPLPFLLPALPFSPHPGGSGPFASIWGSSLFPSAKKKVHSATASPQFGLDGEPASRWLSLGGRSHAERLWGCVHWTAESAWAQAHSHCRGGSAASPACGRIPPVMELCSLMNMTDTVEKEGRKKKQVNDVTCM